MALGVEAENVARAEYESEFSVKRITELEIYRLKNEKILEILLVSGAISKETLERARNLVEALAI